ncbi:hypothetical protein ACFYOC_24210 [Nocardiopsis alba]|uniref:hypothetical protein n=1 Tax=Nocardiopsis alba TaxID=53437 RepID=UPI0036C04F89
MNQPNVFKFSSIENGVDYLRSTVDTLLKHEEEPNPKSLKYVILHLHAAVEVLLKHRLLLEGWELIFENPEEVSYEKYVGNRFRSVGVVKAISRLEETAGIDFRNRDTKALDKLSKSRNALQHWGYEASVAAIEGNSLKVLEFLMSFLYSELLDELESHEQELIKEEMEWIKQGTKQIRGFVEARKKRVEPERDEARSSRKLVLDCPDCLENFLVSYDTENKCLLCPKEWDASELLTSYMEEILNISDYQLLKDGDSSPRKWCPQCGVETLLLGALTSSSGDPEHACFTCGLTFSYEELDECNSCFDMFYASEDSDPECQTCFRRGIGVE